MDGNSQQQDAQRPMMDQRQQPQQQWYGAPQNPYQQQQQPQAYKWPGYDPAIQYAQPPMQSYQQDYYMQQHHHQHYAHSLPPQPQIWPSSNDWNETQWSQPVTTTTGSEEEDWAAKARAWAAAKAAQEAAQQAAQQAQLQAQAEAQAQSQAQAQAQAQSQALAQSQTAVQQEQSYHDYQQQAPQAVQQRPREASPQQSSLIPPGQEASQQGFAQDAPPAAGYGQDGHIYPPQEPPPPPPPPLFVQDDVAPPSFGGQDGASSAYAQAAAHAQVVSSSYSQDVSSSYGQDSAIAAPPGTESQQSDQKSSHTASIISQQPQLGGQVSPRSQPQQQFPFQESATPAFEFHQLQQFDYQQPPPPQDYQQQPPSPYLPPVPTMGMDAAEMNFGGAPNAIWPPLGGQGMAFPPNLGPGRHPGPQFDHPHHNHHPHPMHGHQAPHMFPRQHGPQHGPGFRPPGPPLGGPFGFGGGPQGPGAMGPPFLPDGNGNLGVPDRPKKAPVPSWLREELLKKKSTVGISTSAVMPMSDDFVRMNGSEPNAAVMHKLTLPERARSDSSGMSDNDVDDDEDEDDKEAARTAAMNQEIKRVLTEVLLKVTDDLFDEIAQEVMEEDDVVEGPGQKPISLETERSEVPHSTSSPSPPAAPVIPAPARVLVAPAVRGSKVSSEDDSDNDSRSSEAPLGNVLGLATYASDEEDGERGSRNYSASMDPESSTEEQKGREQAEKRGREKAEDKSGSDRKGGRPLKEDVSDGRKAHPAEDTRNISPFEEKERKEKKEKEREKDKRDIDGGKKDKERDRDRGRDRETKGREKLTEMVEKKEQTSEVAVAKGKKRSNEDSDSNDPDTRSPRVARHSEAQQSMTQPDLSSKEKGVSGRQAKSGRSRHHVSDSKDEKESLTSKAMQKRVDLGEQALHPVHGHVAPAVKEVKLDTKHEKHSKESRVKSVEESAVVTSGVVKPRVESTDLVGKKNRDHEDGNKEREHSKHHSHDPEKEKDKVDRFREKEKARSKDQDKENDRSHEKERVREERGVDRERSRGERGRDRGRVHERDRRKLEKDRIERVRDRRKESRDSRRSKRRSSSSSSRGRSRSRSLSSGSRGSSSDGETGRSPRQRRPPPRMRRRPVSVSRSPVRSRRRRPSRSRSRSPPSKYSHRRHSPSPSRETER